MKRVTRPERGTQAGREGTGKHMTRPEKNIKEKKAKGININTMQDRKLNEFNTGKSTGKLESYHCITLVVTLRYGVKV